MSEGHHPIVVEFDPTAATWFRVGGALVSFNKPHGLIEMQQGAQRLTAPASELVADESVVARWHGTWLCFVGLRSGSIAAAPSLWQLNNFGSLERLDLGGSYDPGGLQRVKFFEFDAHEILIETEWSLARVSPTAGLLWRHIHENVTTHVVELRGERILMENEDEAYELRACDGATRRPRPNRE